MRSAAFLIIGERSSAIRHWQIHAACIEAQLGKDRERSWVYRGYNRPLVGHAQGSVTSKYIHTLDTALIIAADTISGYVQGLLDGVEFRQATYALDRDAALARFLCKAFSEPFADAEQEQSLAP